MNIVATAIQPDALREAVAANEFLTALFGSLKNGYINIWTDDRTSHWFCWNEIEQASAFVDSVNGSQNIWFQTGVMGSPLGSDRRGTEADVIALGGFEADVDFGTNGHKKKNLPPCLEDALSIIEEAPLPPTFIVHSGNGLQPHWLFNEVLVIENAEQRQKFKALKRALQLTLASACKKSGWDFDMTDDLVRLMRIPGTSNLKDPANPKGIRVICGGMDGQRYHLEEFESVLTITQPEHGHADVIDFASPLSAPAIATSIGLPSDDFLGHSRASTDADRGILPMLANAKNQKKFTDLSEGRWEGYGYQSRSEACQGLCSLVAFYTQDAQQVARIVGSTWWGSYEKWQRRDWVASVVSNAIEFVEKNGKYDGGYKNPREAEAPKANDGIILINAADVEPQTVQWLWKDRIALGGVTLIYGDPGLGKSTMTLDLAARVSSGLPFPDGSSSIAGGVLIATAEDGIAQVVVPRLLNSGADMRSIHVIDCIKENVKGKSVERYFTLADAPKLEMAVRNTASKLVVIDPVGAYLNGVDSHRDADVRQLVQPLAKLAERCNCSIVMVAHMNKSSTGQKALYRAMGSLAFTGAARSAFVVVEDRNDKDRRLFLCSKNNYAPKGDGLAFRFEEGGKITWEDGAVTVTADDALTEAEAVGKGDSAVQWLKEQLSCGAVDSKLIMERANQEGIASRTLWRAKDTLNIKATKTGYQGRWLWELPADSMKSEAEDDRPF